MANAQLKNKTWFGSITLAIKALMGMIVSLVSVAEKGIAMADASVEQAEFEHSIDLTLRKANYKKNAVTKASAQQDQVKKELERYINGDQATATRVQASYDELMKLCNIEEAKLAAKYAQEE